ncbi:MAG TPA: thiamine-phosphate kinase [Acidimicrobiales bacterium]|nr:thiamine-phosphate kinase [Acidimicrobiales bacterium]
MGEFAAIERFRQMLPQPPPGETWIGDDAAVVAAPAGALLLTADSVVAGVHVDLNLVGLDDFGWKAVAAAVSDVAAMGGQPKYLLVSVCAPEGTDIDLLYVGIADAGAEYRCPVVGGDLSGGSQLMVSMTVVGDAGTTPPVMRSGASAGDTIFLTGPVGSSAAGLRRLREAAAHPAGGRNDPLARAHRRPRARPAEGAAARAGGATAMIDISDGLAADLRHLAAASGVGVVLQSVPVAEGATLDEALGGGEDYELVFTAADSARVMASFAEAALRAPIAFGRCTGDPDERVLAGEPLPEGGWEHWI